VEGMLEDLLPLVEMAKCWAAEKAGGGGRTGSSSVGMVSNWGAAGMASQEEEDQPNGVEDGVAIGYGGLTESEYVDVVPMSSWSHDLLITSREVGRSILRQFPIHRRVTPPIYSNIPVHQSTLL
jgi:hypothetical protein